ncbi:MULTISPECIES: glycosyltransferase family 2 protein [Alphaproteobacteria]|uniref:glycosyltransferase family 2 protein n=1 Tax=Alphaproteobacteria TaxID=28211 RepID=UPI003A8F40D4
MTPEISVIIPSFNRAATILPTLMSVKDQTFENFECIVVDDGSDDAGELEEVVASLNDPRFRVIHRENGGGGAARNTGIEAATAPWIAFLDSDDLFLPEKLAVYRERFADAQETTVFYSQNLVDRGVEKRWVRPHHAIGPDEDVGEYMFVKNCFIQTSTIAVRTSFILRVMFDPTLRKGQDLDLCLRLSHAGAHFVMLAHPQSIWVDQSEEGRTSRHRGYEAPLAWLDKSSPIMTPKAIRGYRATTLAYYMAPEKPFKALSYILAGWMLAGVPLSITIRQILRSFVPSETYRKLVNIVVRRAGV